MIRSRTIPGLLFAALATTLFLNASPLLADGLEDALPPPLEGHDCADPQRIALGHAADAVRAAFLPLQPLAKENVMGVTLHDDPRAIAIVKRALGQKPPPGWSEATRCKDAICALRAALGGSREGALWMLEIGIQGPVASLDQSPWSDDKVSVWSAAELRTIAATLDDLPGELLFAAKTLRAFRRVPDGDTLPGNANALSERNEARLDGGGSILLRDTVWKMDPLSRREVIAHELGHHRDYAQEKLARHPYGISHSPAWLKLGGWSKEGEPDVPGGFHREPSGEEPWTAGSWPSEEFANGIAEYRYQARLFRALSPAAYQFIGTDYPPDLPSDYQKAEPDSGLDALIAQAGGRVALALSCAPMVERTFERKDGGPAHLSVLHTKPDGGTENASWDRFSFVTHSPCVGMVLEALQKQPGYTAFACRRDPDDLWVRVAERLQDVEAAMFEGSRAVLAARTPAMLEACLARRDLRTSCLAGARGQEIARVQATHVLAEFGEQSRDPTAQTLLARAILSQAALLPPEDEVLSRVPALGDSREMFAACLGAATSITYKGAGEWRYWVKVPPKNDTEGYGDPVRTAACSRDFFLGLSARGVQLDPEAIGPFARALRSDAALLAQQFNQTALGSWDALRAACGIAPGGKAKPGQQPCAARWLEGKLAPLVPEGTSAALADKLAAELKGP